MTVTSSPPSRTQSHGFPDGAQNTQESVTRALHASSTCLNRLCSFVPRTNSAHSSPDSAHSSPGPREPPPWPPSPGLPPASCPGPSVSQVRAWTLPRHLPLVRHPSPRPAGTPRPQLLGDVLEGPVTLRVWLRAGGTLPGGRDGASCFLPQARTLHGSGGYHVTGWPLFPPTKGRSGTGSAWSAGRTPAASFQGCPFLASRGVAGEIGAVAREEPQAGRGAGQVPPPVPATVSYQAGLSPP